MKKANENKTLKQMVAEANAIENAVYTEFSIPADILEKVKKDNVELYEAYCKKLAGKSKKAFFETFMQVKVKANLPEKETEKAIKEAVSITQTTLKINDAGQIEIDYKLKPVSFADVIKAKETLLATKNADGKATKQDKINAIRHFFGSYGKGYADIITHNARQFTSIGNADDTDETYTLNANYEKAMTMLNEKYSKAGKENPFANQSGNAYTMQIMDIVEYFLENAEIKLFSYHCKALFQMVCNRNKFGKLTIAGANDIVNSLAIVYRYAYNGYKLPTNDKSDIYKAL